jgi:CRP-like cAMP-binding protein
MIADILGSTGFYNHSEVELFERNTTMRSMSKDEIVVNRGEICRSAFFNITGAFYQFNYKDEIDLNVIDLHCDNEWFLNHSSFISQKPSDSFIKAYTDGKILELDIESLHFLISRSPAFLQLAKIFDQATLRIHFFDNRLTPLEKYQYILNNRQQLIQIFPLKFIASYLKITPETLSRVRENLSKGN